MDTDETILVVSIILLCILACCVCNNGCCFNGNNRPEKRDKRKFKEDKEERDGVYWGPGGAWDKAMRKKLGKELGNV